MGDSNDGLTLEGLARILREHIDETTARFAEVAGRFDSVGARIDNLRGEIGLVATIVRDLAQIVARQVDEIGEHRQQIRQIYARMEQHDGRFETLSRDICRILDAMERRGGDGGSREA